MKYESTEGRLYMSRSACIAAVRRQIGWMAKEGVHFTLHPKTATRSPFATTWVWERLEPKGQSTGRLTSRPGARNGSTPATAPMSSVTAPRLAPARPANSTASAS